MMYRVKVFKRWKRVKNVGKSEVGMRCNQKRSCSVTIVLDGHSNFSCQIETAFFSVTKLFPKQCSPPATRILDRTSFSFTSEATKIECLLQ